MQDFRTEDYYEMQADLDSRVHGPEPKVGGQQP